MQFCLTCFIQFVKVFRLLYLAVLTLLRHEHSGAPVHLTALDTPEVMKLKGKRVLIKKNQALLYSVLKSTGLRVRISDVWSQISS